VGGFCHPLERSNLSKLDRNPFSSRTVSPRTMSRVVFARLRPAPDDPRSEPHVVPAPAGGQAVRDTPPIGLPTPAELGLAGADLACRVVRLAAAQGQSKAVVRERHVPQWGADASPSASPRTGRYGLGFPARSGSSTAVMPAVATTRYPRQAIAPGQTTRAKSAVDGEGEQHTGKGLPPLLPRSRPYPGGLPR
jgi:hypothetical protein